MMISANLANRVTIARPQAACSHCDHTAEAAPADHVHLAGGPSAESCPTGLCDHGHQTAQAAALAASNLPGAAVIQAPRPEITAKLQEKLGPRPFHISKEQAAELSKDLNLSSDQLMVELIPVAKANARPPISNYLVGAVGRGASGDLYLGVNLEMPNQALNQSVHGEQFVTANALAHGEKGLSRLAVSAEPCGHCRQFLNELQDGGDLGILIPGQEPVELKTLLPRNFGPKDLGIEGALLASPDFDLKLANDTQDPTVLAALDAAKKSYAPYSKCPSGIAIEANGKVYANGYAENAAFNPSLSPLQSTLVELVADGVQYSDIQRVVLVEREQLERNQASQEGISRLVLESIAPDASFEVHHAS
ncbi:MAG: cytidine deaminase [Vulcanimicrobiota bacterium]